MDRKKILQEAKAELERHVWGTFVEGNMSVALGGAGVVVSGCEACRKRFGTNSQYLRHLADDVLPRILESALQLDTSLTSHLIMDAGMSGHIGNRWCERIAAGDCGKLTINRVGELCPILCPPPNPTECYLVSARRWKRQSALHLSHLVAIRSVRCK
jgi:hypothetical protein